MKKLQKILIFTILIFGFISQLFSQTWPISKQIKCDNDLRILDIQTDQNDDLFISGVFKGTLYDSTARGNFDIFLMKLNQDYEILWYKTFGSTLRDHNPNFIIDQANNIFLTGSFQDSCVFEDTYLKSAGLNDIFLLKYSPSGSLNWVKNLATFPSKQLPAGIEVDKNNDLLIIGSFIDSVEINSTPYISEGSNQFILKTDTSSNSTVWLDIYPNSHSSTKLSSVSAFDDGYYFNGYCYDTLIVNTDTLISEYIGKSDLFLYRTDFDGNNPWIRRTYGDGNDVTGSITQDNYGNIYYTGYFNSPSLTADSIINEISNVTLTNNGDFDIFIYKYNKSGKLVWSKSYGLEGRDYGININQNGDILYIGGYFSDSIIFNEDTLLTSGVADWDLFLSTFDLNGNIYNAAKIGNTDGVDIGQALYVTDDSKAIIAGYFQSSSIVVGDSTYTNTGVFDGIVAKYYAPLSTAFTKITNPTCNSQSNGELIITPIFGEMPYTYSWSHNGLLNDSTATGLSAGLYSVTVTDAVDSTDVAQYTLSEPGAFIFNPAITQVTTCSYSQEGAINLNVTGGNGGNTYQWFESEGGSGVQLTNEDQTNLAIGRYDVTVTDSKSCSDDTVIYITGPGSVIFNSSEVTDDSGVDPIHNGAINLILTGGTGADPDLYGASWTGPAGYTALVQDISSLAGGNYSVTITDDNSCLFDSMFTVVDLDTLFAYISDKKDDCTGGAGDGTATVSYNTPNGNAVISYLWSNGGTTATITGLVPGTYKVTVTDSNLSETSEDSVDIFDLGYTIAGNLSGTSDVDCKGDADGYIDLTITTPGQPPYVYNWSNGGSTQDITNLPAGTYSVTVTDDNSCTLQILDRVISEPEFDLTASAFIVTEPLCNGDINGEIRVDAAGGNGVYSYQWNDPGSQTTQVADGLDAGFYIVTVTDFKGCTTTDNVNLTQPGVLSVSGSIGDLTCFNDNSGTIALTVGGGTPIYSYYWTTSDGSGLVAVDKNQSGLSVGTYEVTVTDGNLCEVDDAFTVTEPPVLEITNEEKTNVTICNGDNTGTITITATGGTGVLTYILNPGAIQTNNTGAFTGISAGTYTVDVDDENGCGPVTSSSIEITEPTQISITSETPTDISCNGLTDGQIVIVASGGTGALQYSINNGTTYQASDTFTGLAQGTNYQVKVQDANLCEVAGATLIISEPAIINLESSNAINPACNGSTDGSIDITISGGTVAANYIYSWATTDGSGLVADAEDQTGLSAGTYDVTVTDDNSCASVFAIVLDDPLEISIDSENSTDASSQTTADGTITVVASGGTGNLTYDLNPGDDSNITGIFNTLLPGDYTVDVTDENACGPVSSSTITVGYTNAIDDLIISDKIKLYPNPTSAKLNVEIDFEIDDVYKIEILTISGQVLFNKEIKSHGITKEELDLSNYPKGIYFIRIYNNQFIFKEKILLQ